MEDGAPVSCRIRGLSTTQVLRVVPQEVRKVEAPAYVPKVRAAEASKGLAGALVTPAERRAALAFEVKAQRANATIKKGELQARRLTHYMRAHHPHGVLGVDSTANPTSDVYGETARSFANAETQHADHAEKRRGNLKHILCGEETHGYFPFGHDASERPGIRFLQAKTTGACRPPYDTHSRLFEKEDFVVPHNRRQKLRNYDLHGKAHGGPSGRRVAISFKRTLRSP